MARNKFVKYIIVLLLINTPCLAVTLIDEVGTEAATGSTGSALLSTLSGGFFKDDLVWTHNYSAIIGTITSATITVDTIDADIDGRLKLYTGTDNTGFFIASSAGNDNGSPGAWQSLSGNSVDNTFSLDSSLFSDLADGTFDLFGDNFRMSKFGSNRALLTIEYTPSIVPIPAAVWLFGSGLLGLIIIPRRLSRGFQVPA